MKSYIAVAALLCPAVLWAQTQLISQSPENRTVLIEHVTGINAGEGTLGYDAMNAVHTANPLETSIISYHAGGFAQPVAGQPDFQTVSGTDISNYFSVQQHPRGIVNRRPYQSAYAVHYNDYMTLSNQVRNMSSPVNVGMVSSFNASTRDLTVNVEFLYTANSPGVNDYLTVMLVESDVIGWQTDFVNGDHTAYAHQWLYRAPLVGAWGDEIMGCTAGQNETRTYMINVDAAYDIANCWVVAFIAEDHDDVVKDVYQARHVAADGGSTAVGIQEESKPSVLGYAFPSPATDQITIPFIELSENVTLRITDALGKLVAEEMINAGTTSIELSTEQWESGMYSYQVILSNGESAIRRIVVQ